MSRRNNVLTVAVSKSHEKRLPIRETVSHLRILLQKLVFAGRSSPLLNGSAQLEVLHARDFGDGRFGGFVNVHGNLCIRIRGMENGSFECRQGILLYGADRVAQRCGQKDSEFMRLQRQHVGLWLGFRRL